MDIITSTIVVAMCSGFINAISNVTEDIGTSLIKSIYKDLKMLLQEKLKNNSSFFQILEQLEKKPTSQKYQLELSNEIIQFGIDKDIKIKQVTFRLLEETEKKLRNTKNTNQDYLLRKVERVKIMTNLEGPPADYLKGIALEMEKYIHSENESTINRVIEQVLSEPSLLSRLFPTDLQREQERLAIERLKSVHRCKEEFFTLYTNIQLEIARKQGNALVSCVGMHLQAQLTGFATNKIDEITQIIGESKSKFLKRIKEQYQELEECKSNRFLHKTVNESIEQEIKAYFDSLKKLLEGFIKALEAKVGGMP